MKNIDLETQLNQLESQRVSEQKVLQEAQSALEKAKAELKKTGKYADPDWFASTKTIVRDKTVSIHSLNRRIKEIKFMANRNYDAIYNFVKAANKLLSTQQLNQIAKLSQELSS